MDPLAGSQWSAPGTVAGFAQSAPNAVLMTFAEEERRRAGRGWVLDLGCGAGRNAVPLARLGWTVVGTDLSWPMLCAAATRTQEDRTRRPPLLGPRADGEIPARDRSFDLVIAHGIWNLARSAAQFRRALDERPVSPSRGRACLCSPFRGTRSLRRRSRWPANPLCSRSSPASRSASSPRASSSPSWVVRLRAGPRCSLPRVQPAAAGDVAPRDAPVIYEAAFRYIGRTGRATPSRRGRSSSDVSPAGRAPPARRVGLGRRPSRALALGLAARAPGARSRYHPRVRIGIRAPWDPRPARAGRDRPLARAPLGTPRRRLVFPVHAGGAACRAQAGATGGDGRTGPHARLRVVPRLDAATLRFLAYHIVAVTLLGVALLVVGVAIRTGAMV